MILAWMLEQGANTSALVALKMFGAARWLRDRNFEADFWAVYDWMLHR